MFRKGRSSRKSRFAPYKRRLITESLEDRRLLAFTGPLGGEPSHVFAVAEGTISSPGGKVAETLDTSTYSMPRAVAVLGFEVAGSAGLDPDAVQLSGPGVLSYRVLADLSGSNNNSLVLARIGLGSINVTIGGQGGTTGDYSVKVFLPGDDDGSRGVELYDIRKFPARLRSSTGDAKYAVEVDADLDGTITRADMSPQRLNYRVSVVEPPPAVGSPPIAVDDDLLGAAVFTMYSGGTLIVFDGAGDIVQRNDIVGSPAATISSFGGGTLGGGVADNPAGTFVPLGVSGPGVGLLVNADGSFHLVTAPSQVGRFTFDYRLTNTFGSSDATVTIEIKDATAPTVSLTAPTAGATFIEGTTLNLAASAADNIAVTGVEFFVGGSSVHFDNSAPFEYTTTAPNAIGLVPVLARALDAAGNTADATHNINVIADLPPTVTITAPNNNDNVVEGSTVTFSATATDHVEVTQVQFFVDGASVAVDTSAPFTTTFTVPASPSPLALQAVATDSKGQTTPDTINVNIIPSTPPTAAADSYGSIGNLGINVPAAEGVLSNDTLAGGSITAFDKTSTGGGTVSLNTNGSFTYDPGPGFEGVGGFADTFTYTLTNGAGSRTGTVTIDVTNPIWFIDNSALGGSNEGTLDNPFQSIDDFNTSVAPEPGEDIFLYEGTGTYNETDGINLQDNQQLIGEGTTAASLQSVLGITLPTHSNPLPGINGTRPEIETSNNSGVDLASGNTIRGIDIGNTGNGVGMLGSTVGSLTIDEASITGSGGGIAVSTSGTLAVDFDEISTSGSFSGIALSNVAGDFDVTTGTIDSGGANAVSITGAASVDLGVTLTSVSSSAGANVGISLSNTTGSFSVTGTGSTAGSGGTIADKTGADESTTSGIGVFLSSATNVSLANMQLNDFSNFGIRGVNVNGFTLTDSVIQANASSTADNGTSATLAEGSVSFRNLTGTAIFEGSRIEDGFQDNIVVTNAAGTLNMTVRDSSNDAMIIGLNNSGSGGGDGILVESRGIATLNLNVTDTQFLGARGDLVQTNTLGSSIMDVTLQDNSFSNSHSNIAPGGGGIKIFGGGASSNFTLTYDISGTTPNSQTFSGADGNAITVNFVSGDGTATGNIENNKIGIAGTPGSGSATASGISVGTSNSVRHEVIIDSNDIDGIAGIEGIAGSAGIALVSNLNSTAAVGGLFANVTGNTINELSASTRAGINMKVGGAGSSDTSYLCADISGNTIDASGSSGGLDIFVDQVNDPSAASSKYNFPGYTGPSTTTVDEEVISFLNGQNTLAQGAAGSAGFPLNNVSGSGSTCVAPPTLTAAGGQGAGRESLSHAALEATVTNAIARFEAAGLSAAQQSRLDAVEVQIADLADGILGQASGNQLIIDIDAAGWGWFVDATPNESAEFNSDGVADSSSEAHDRIDLLTAVIHELGHLLGLKHGDGLMSETLGTSTRADLDAFFANFG